MEYEMRSLYVSDNMDGIEKMRVLQKSRLDTYRRMLESSRTMTGADVMPDVDAAGKCNEREECGENA